MTFGLALLMATGAAAQAAARTEPMPLVPLHHVLNPEDYPAEALRKKEEGSVRYRLSIGSAGEIRNCEVLKSSGSVSLDEGTCKLLRSRARFSPAKDEAGRQVEGHVENSVTWRLEADGEQAYEVSRLDAVTRLWVACVRGEAAKRVFTPADVGQIPDAAFAACQAVEAKLKIEMGAGALPGMVPAKAMEGLREHFRTIVAEEVGRARKLLFDPAKPQSK